MPGDSGANRQLLDLIDVVEEISEESLSLSPKDLLSILLERTCRLLHAPVGILWALDKTESKLRVEETFGPVDGSYTEIELELRHPSIQYVASKNQILTFSRINQLDHKRLVDLNEIQKQKWVSLMSTPLKDEEKLLGILDVFFTQEKTVFKLHETKVLKILGSYLSLSLQRIKAIEKSNEIFKDRQNLQALNVVMQNMVATSNEQEIWNLLVEGAEAILNVNSCISIARLNYGSGELEAIGSKESSSIKINSGITGKALREEKPVIANNVMSAEWTKTYVKKRADTRSEMSVPIVIENIPIRQETKVELGSKPVGILNIESNLPNAFTDTEKERLLLLARHAALRIDGLEIYNKLSGIRRVEKEISQAHDDSEIIERMIRGITKVLQFSWVNVSLIDPERTTIKSQYISGLSSKKAERFKKIAIHPLGCTDIQAEIVSDRKIKVPADNDPGLDAKIFHEFGHKNLVRVFIPMIEPVSNLVIGTVEAGYQKAYRPCIYEQDVQILRSFVDVAMQALERRKSGLIDRITHELKSPIVGIRSHASFLQRRFSDVRVSPSSITFKLEDIQTDCELLLYQVGQIENFLGRSVSAKPKYERIRVFRDVIIKTINQLKPFLLEREFSPRGIEYQSSDISKIIISTDKAMLSQVIYNLLINAIKYAEKDPEQFKIVLEVSEVEHKSNENFIVKFKDWGIGVNKEDKDKIFQEGFRTKEAIKKVGGSGLGLNISKSIMRKLGGDLNLVSCHKPTEFHVILPKSTRGNIR
jgi:signal transduction histidine kinase/GAF domain-containing protein